MAVEIQFVSSYSDIDESLWAGCFPHPLEGRFWYETLESCGLQDQFEFFYALIRDGDRNIGIAPCFVHNVPMSLVAPPVLANVLEKLSRVWPQAGFQRTLFVGSPCADEGTIGLMPGIKLDDIIVPLGQAVLVRAKKMRAAMVVFKDFPALRRDKMNDLLLRQKYFRIPSYPGADLHLAGSSSEDYFAALGRKSRHNIRKKLRRSKEHLDLVTTFVKRPSDEELDQLFALFMQTYNKGKTKFERLSIEFFRRIRDTEPAWFILQREKNSGKMLTFMLLFKLGDKAINKFIGLDYSQRPDSFLYFRQFEEALNFAYSNNVKELQSGQTGYSAKLELGHTLIKLDNYCRHTNALMHVIYAKLAQDVSEESLDSDLAQYYAARRNKAEATNQVAQVANASDDVEAG